MFLAIHQNSSKCERPGGTPFTKIYESAKGDFGGPHSTIFTKVQRGGLFQKFTSWKWNHFYSQATGFSFILTFKTRTEGREQANKAGSKGCVCFYDLNRGLIQLRLTMFHFVLRGIKHKIEGNLSFSSPAQPLKYLRVLYFINHRSPYSTHGKKY